MKIFFYLPAVQPLMYISSENYGLSAYLIPMKGYIWKYAKNIRFYDARKMRNFGKMAPSRFGNYYCEKQRYYPGPLESSTGNARNFHFMLIYKTWRDTEDQK